MTSASQATKKNYTDIDEILALVFDENNESDGDIDLGETEFGGEESDGDIIEYELHNIAISTPKQASSIDLVPDFIPNTSVISENDNSEFILPLPNIDHGNTNDHISNVNIGCWT